MVHYSCLLAESLQSTATVTVLAPFDLRPIATVENATAAQVESALTHAFSSYQDKSRWIPTPQRIEILEKLITLIRQQQETLAIDAAREGGKPLIDSKVEVARGIDGIKICIETLRTDAGQVIPMDYNKASANRIAFTQKQPIGVVVAISAFNHPFNLIIHQVAAAVAAGCPVIVKPATSTPLSCLRLVHLLHEAGLPKTHAQAIVTDNNQLAEKLCTDSRVAFFSFIGSAKVGWMLRSKLAPGTRCALEHGGVAPVIVAADANLDRAIPLLAKGGFYHAGQVCVSVQRIFVHHTLVNEFSTRLAAEIKPLKVGDPTSEETDIGPLISPHEIQRISQWVDDAINKGATLICGGKTISETCYEPTILLNPPADCTISQHEVFGPVVCIYSIHNLEQGIAQANNLPFAFQGAVFTENLNTALMVYQQLDGSAIMVNDHTAFRVDGMPFAGLKHSGLGVGGIPHTMADMQIEKMLVIAK